MNAITRAFTDHPASVGETYVGHMAMALRFSGLLAVAAMACLVHALLPFCFERAASRRIARLHAAMVAHRPSAAQAPRTA